MRAPIHAQKSAPMRCLSSMPMAPKYAKNARPERVAANEVSAEVKVVVNARIGASVAHPMRLAMNSMPLKHLPAQRTVLKATRRQKAQTTQASAVNVVHATVMAVIAANATVKHVKTALQKKAIPTLVHRPTQQPLRKHKSGRLAVHTLNALKLQPPHRPQR